MTGRMGQGVIDGRHRLSVTTPAGYLFWGEADVVLAVGTRLQPQQQNWGLDDKLKIIRIDADSEELDRQRKPEIGIVGDADGDAEGAGRPARPQHNGKRNGRAEHVAEIKATRQQGRCATSWRRRSPTSRRSARRCPRTASWSMS